MSTVFKGARQLQDMQTGEIIDTQVVEKTVGDVGFHKIWLHEILDLVDEVGNAKMKVLMWLLSHADAQNRIYATWAEIAEGTDVGRTTVSALMAKLKAANVISEVRRSVWRLNPDVIFKGDHNKRMSVLIRYKNEKQKDLFDEDAPAQTKTQALRRVA
ncbi:replication/maintenance protein RepL [Caballeronia sp. NCTM1]|uniref:replication/maintenance protein RepL n=1 Tax=Caballeronia sp. NCTM1 TaxID=2921753 RepID=UPI002029372D|nr:replication/maintenance protein RepL [Caballeronia sp. NCTM1]